MDPLRELPMGFGMALFENERAARYFESLSHERQQAILGQQHSISSKQEMQAFVDSLPDQK